MRSTLFKAPSYPILPFIFTSIRCPTIKALEECKKALIKRFKFSEEIAEKLSKIDLQDSEKRYRALFHSNSQPMYIYDKATLKFIEVNESGTEAAAVTGVMMTRMMIMYNSMIVNKPFLFIIRSKELDQFMFIAKVDKLD